MCIFPLPSLSPDARKGMLGSEPKQKKGPLNLSLVSAHFYLELSPLSLSPTSAHQEGEREIVINPPIYTRRQCVSCARKNTERELSGKKGPSPRS